MALQLSLFEPGAPLPIAGSRAPLDAPVTHGRRRWAWLLRHVFEADLTVCSRCGGGVQLEAVATSVAIEPIVARHGLAERARPPPPARSLGQLPLPVDD